MKTAEDFARDVEFELDTDTIAKAFTQFAAQEVEAYKERLKEFVEEQYFSNSSLESFSLFHIQQLIDTVK